jgi:hypothetical protein
LILLAPGGYGNWAMWRTARRLDFATPQTGAFESKITDESIVLTVAVSPSFRTVRLSIQFLSDTTHEAATGNFGRTARQGKRIEASLWLFGLAAAFSRWAC